MKRVVTDVDNDGRSYVASSNEVQSHIIWEFQPDHIRDRIVGIDPMMVAEHMEPPVSGGARWAKATIAPGVAVRGSAGVDERGFHSTRTVDFVYVLDGELILELDVGTAELKEGDCVVQQATRHAWNNVSGKPSTILILMYKPFVPGKDEG